MSWSDDYLEHHGILGQKWGVRRFQNKDGSLTEKGKKRQEVLDTLDKKANAFDKKQSEAYDKSNVGKAYKKWRKANPNADEDDFGDYMVDHNIKDDFNYKPNKYRNEHDSLTGTTIRNNLVGNALISSLTIAPIVGGLTTMATGSASKGFEAWVGTVGAISMYGLGSDIADKRELEKKYGLR